MNCSYLIPANQYEWVQGDGRAGAWAELDSLVQGLIDAQQVAIHMAQDVLGESSKDEVNKNPLYQQALSTAHAQAFATQWGSGVACCVLKGLRKIAGSVLAMSRGQLMRLAQTLDTHKRSDPVYVRASEDFYALLALLRNACCCLRLEPGNLMLDVQTLIPLLSKLSCQIDNEALALGSQSTSLEALNQQVHQVLTSTQSIVNLLNDWQDSLAQLMEAPRVGVGITRDAHFYEDQIHTGIVYWQAMHDNLSHSLERTT